MFLKISHRKVEKEMKREATGGRGKELAKLGDKPQDRHFWVLKFFSFLANIFISKVFKSH